MFGKLLKNDLKAQWYSMSTLFTVIFIIAAAAELITIFSKSQIAVVFGGLAVVISLLVGCVFIIVAVAMMYSKTMFGRAGYLTLTLPVKTSSLIWSKTVSSLIWIFTVYFLFIGSFFLWVYQVKESLGGDVVESAETILSLFGMPTFQQILITVIFYLISLAVTVLMVVQCVYLGVTCSNVSPISKFGNIGAIIIFFATFLILQRVSTAFSNLLPIGMVVAEDVLTFTSNTAEVAKNFDDPMQINFAGVITRLIFAIFLHFPVCYLTKEKVNVQ